MGLISNFSVVIPEKKRQHYNIENINAQQERRTHSLSPTSLSLQDNSLRR